MRVSFPASCTTDTHSWMGQSCRFAAYGCGGSRMRLTCTHIHYCAANFVGGGGIFYVMGFFCVIWKSGLCNLRFLVLVELLPSWWSCFAHWLGTEWKLSEVHESAAELSGDVWPKSPLFPAHCFPQHLLSWLVLMSGSSTGAWGNSQLSR